MQTNIRENRRDNQYWRIQRHWQHWIHKTQTNKTKNTTQKTKKMSNMDPIKNCGMNPGAREE